MWASRGIVPGLPTRIAEHAADGAENRAADGAAAPIVCYAVAGHFVAACHEDALANRLSSIVTRTGDDGTTGLGDGSRLRKDALRVQAMGEIDELNSHIGLLLTEALPPAIREDLVDIQHDLFDLGAELCLPGQSMLAAARVLGLDARLAHYNGALPRLAEFILPGGNRAAAQAHVCRTVCRRAERTLVALGSEEAVSETVRQYCNRLSDLLFVLARSLNRAAADGPAGGVGGEPQWQPHRTRGA
jgi:cob(I)alamin adenosyltransferase